jgi:succinate dehydrogenase hydrophobic anchor subunit
MEAGGWNILNQWLSDAKKSQNTPLLIEILQVTAAVYIFIFCTLILD